MNRIPKEWDLVELGQLCEVITKGTTPTSLNFKYKKFGINFIKIESLKENGEFDSNKFAHIDEITNKALSRSILKENDILFAIAGATIGKIAVVQSEILPANTNQALSIIRLKDKSIADYIKWYLNGSYIQRYIRRIAIQSAQPNLNLSHMRKLKIILPIFYERIKIVSILNNIQNLINNIQFIINDLRELKKGLMQRLFTEGIGHTEFEETRLGKIPKEWEIKKLGDIINIYDSERIPLSQIERNERKGNYPYCGATGIIDYIDDYLFDGEYVLLAEDGGPFGKFENSAYIMSGKFWVNNHAHIIQAIHGKTTNLYLLYVLNYLNLLPYIVGSTRQKLNQGDLKKIKIPIPNLAEQESITKILSDLDNKTENEKILKKIFKKIKRGLMQDLLTGKKRVKIN